MSDAITPTQAPPNPNSPPKPMTIDELFNAFGRVMIENDYLRRLAAYYRDKLAEHGVTEG
jgi:hypothetical protein